MHFTQKQSRFLQKWDVVEGIEVNGGDVLFPMRDGGIGDESRRRIDGP